MKILKCYWEDLGFILGSLNNACGEILKLNNKNAASKYMYFLKVEGAIQKLKMLEQPTLIEAEFEKIQQIFNSIPVAEKLLKKAKKPDVKYAYEQLVEAQKRVDFILFKNGIVT